ncbi:MAG: hypothetical protein K0Q83_2374 [Deltaproteobacteria bacterium]|nr:hypothetical protein [Deltaproteobacteria bacterium]
MQTGIATGRVSRLVLLVLDNFFNRVLASIHIALTLLKPA